MRWSAAQRFGRNRVARMASSLQQLMQRYIGADLSTVSGRALVEERYWSLRRQIPIIYLLGFVNLSAMELASTGKLSAISSSAAAITGEEVSEAR